MSRKENKTGFRLVIAGGGTGGHVFPAIAIANSINSVIGKENILFIGAKGKMEEDKVPAAGYDIVLLPVSGMRNKYSPSNILVGIRLIRSVIKTLTIFKNFRPDGVVGVGGFASAPALFAARILRIPYYIQEQNSIPGKVNKIMSRNASMVFAGFPGTEQKFNKSEVLFTGNPVRSIIQESKNKKIEGCEYFKISRDKQTVLVVGGSQGAKSINLALAQCIEDIVNDGIQVIWQTGKDYFEIASTLVKEKNLEGVIATPFIDRMELAYGAASAVISRAGALAIAEICLAELPSILVPYPYAAEDHQTFNASSMVKEGAALMIADNELDVKLKDTVVTLLKNNDALFKMSEKAKQLGRPYAATEIVNRILRAPNGLTYHAPDPFAANIVYFLGIGGIGMSALARWFLLMGKMVYGYDKTETRLTKTLESEGMVIHYTDDPKLIPQKTDLVVLTPAVPEDMSERVFLENSKIPIIKRATLLGLLSQKHTTIAIAGTHGKTSVTALVTHLLKSAGLAVTGFVGGVTKNYSSNFVYTPNSKFLVAEADEYDRSFLHLKPDFSIITSTEPDHLDIYKSKEKLLEAFEQFAKLSSENSPVILGPEIATSFNRKTQKYSIDQDTPYRAQNLRKDGFVTKFDYISKGVVIEGLQTDMSGRHSIENAVAAAAAALWAGVTPDQLKEGMKTFKGVKRRFDIVYESDSYIYVDDYAHHPTEIKATIKAIRERWPGRKITGIFQPHLYSRTRDFMKEFGVSLSELDVAVLLDIYPAREKPIEGITSEALLKIVMAPEKYCINKNSAINWIKENKIEILVTMGAGDIDTLVPEIENQFKKGEK